MPSPSPCSTAGKPAGLPAISALSFSSPRLETGKQWTKIEVEKWPILSRFAVLPLCLQPAGLYQYRDLSQNSAIFSSRNLSQEEFFFLNLIASNLHNIIPVTSVILIPNLPSFFPAQIIEETLCGRDRHL